MPNLNKVVLIGYLTDAPEVNYSQTGKPYGKIKLAVNTFHGEKQETLYIDCSVFGKTAETVQKYAGKGSCLYIEGRLRLDTWEDKETGRKRSKISVITERMQFMDKKQSGEQPQGQATPPPPAPERQEHRYSRADAMPPMPDLPDEMPEDELPF